jgi:polysaccharide export outer membrane protein
MKKLLLFSLLVACQLSAQTFAPGSNASAATAPTTTPTAVAPNSPADYLIGTEDVLQVSVWKEPDFSATAIPVRADGKISLPLLNDVQASGLTPQQLSRNITERLRQYVAEPRVTVIVTAMNSRRAYVMGQVLRQGAVSLVSNITVLQAISAAGGLGQFANGKKIYILRTENGKQHRLSFNYNEAIKGTNPEQNIFLKPGDTVVVP